MHFSFQSPVFDVINRLHNSGSFIISLCANYSPTSVSSTEALLPSLLSAGCGFFRHREPTWTSMCPNAHMIQSFMGYTTIHWIYTSCTSLRELSELSDSFTLKHDFKLIDDLYFSELFNKSGFVSKAKQLSPKYWCWGKEGRFDDLFKRRKGTCWFKAFKSQKQIYELLKDLWRAAQSSVLPLWAAAVVSGR